MEHHSHQEFPHSLNTETGNEFNREQHMKAIREAIGA